MTTFVERVDASTLRFERLLPGPIDRVWSFITEADKRARWLAGGNFELTPGGPIRLEFENARLSPLEDDGPPEKYRDLPETMSFTGQVIRCEPPNLLVHTWRDGDTESEVEYRLIEKAGKVRLILTHRRVQESDMLGAQAGWQTHVEILEDILDGRTPRPFWTTHTAHEELFAAR